MKHEDILPLRFYNHVVPIAVADDLQGLVDHETLSIKARANEDAIPGLCCFDGRRDCRKVAAMQCYAAGGITKKRKKGTVIETLAINCESSIVDVNRSQMASETSSKNRILLIAVPTIGLVVILYYSGLLGFATFYIEELMYVILNDIPRFITNVLGLYRY